MSPFLQSGRSDTPKSGQTKVRFRPEADGYIVIDFLLIGDLNRSMQHLDSKYREEDVADEVSNKNLLHRC